MSELHIKQDLVKSLSQVDALLLDVDGVILDVSQSFRVVIARTAQMVATDFLKLRDTGAVLEEGDIELFKLAGGFNDDIDLTNAVVALVVAKQTRSGAEDTGAIATQPPSWADYTGEIKRRGGGPEAAQAIILEELSATQRRVFSNNWNPRLVAQLFQEMYGGESACRQLYGFDPEYIREEGLYRREKVLLDPNLIPKRLKTAILTGRNRAESRLALEMANLVERIPETAWMTPEDGVRKPDGETLARLQEKVNFRFGIFVGDTMDDLRTVLNFRETRGSGRARVISCIALSGPAGEQNRRLFLEAGAEIVVPDVNSLLQYLTTSFR